MRLFSLRLLEKIKCMNPDIGKTLLSDNVRHVVGEGYLWTTPWRLQYFWLEDSFVCVPTGTVATESTAVCE
jgi:hypothetical protein